MGAAPYYHFTFARAVALLGVRDCDGVNWYAAGAARLIAGQQPDGAWRDPFAPGDRDLPDVLPTVWNTAFLARATLPAIPAGDRELH